MNIRQYYKQCRQIEKDLPEDNVVVVSLTTADGGREGVVSEVGRRLAARLITEHRARQASREESIAFRKSRSKG